MRTAIDALRSGSRGRKGRCTSAALIALAVLTLGTGVGYAADAPVTGLQVAVPAPDVAVRSVWRDAAGRIVEDYPYHADPDPGHAGRAIRAITGDNFYIDADGLWHNLRSGVVVRSYPRNSEPDPNNPDRAHRPGTGERFHRDVSAQAAVLPPQAHPPVGKPGMVFFTPKVAAGGFGLTGKSSYRSDGGQDPFDNTFTLLRPQGCGGAMVGTGGNLAVLAEFTACSYMTHHTLFAVPRNGAGLVSLDASSPMVFDLLFKGRVAITTPAPGGTWGPLYFSAGIGPTVRKWDLTFNSDQTDFGADVFSITGAQWQTGLVASAGISSFVCLTCIADGPLEIGIEARVRAFPARSISLVSPAFGFTETAATGRTIDYSLLLTAGIPFALW